MSQIEVPEGMNPEVLEHLMDPKNYGKLDEPSGVGVAHDEKTGEYVIFYLDIVEKNTQEIINESRYATNACQDTVVVGSMFTQMIEKETIEHAKKAMQKLEGKFGKLSATQLACASMVLKAFEAALQNHKERVEGTSKAEMHVVTMKESCENDETIS